MKIRILIWLLVISLSLVACGTGCTRSEEPLTDTAEQEMQKLPDVTGLTSNMEKNKVGVFDFENKKVLLNSGYEMPILGLGTYALDYDTCVASVKTLLANGGRLIDTAYMYGNEDAVGEGVRQAMEEYGIPREEIFVITKIYPNQFDDPEAAIEMALEKLDIGYIDMMLLHHPGTNDVKAYQAMETYAAQGKIHSLGLSNWYVEELTEFLPKVTLMPALVQNEIHPYYQEQDVVPFIRITKNSCVVSIGRHPADPEQDQGFQATDIFIGVPETGHVIVVVSAAGRRAGRAGGNQRLFFRMYLVDQRLNRGLIEVHVGDGGEQTFDEQLVCVFGRLRITFRRSCKTDQCAGQLILQSSNIRLFAANTCAAGTAFASGCLLTLETKHFSVHFPYPP